MTAQTKPTMRFDVSSILIQEKPKKSYPRKGVDLSHLKNGEKPEEINESILGNFPELRNIESFRTYPGTPGDEMNQDMVIKYIVLLYSVDSILNEKPLPPLQDRKFKAADMAGFPRDSRNNFTQEVQTKLFALGCDYIINMAHAFLVYQNSNTWAEICILQQEIQELQINRFEPVSGKDDKERIMALEKKNKFMESCHVRIKIVEEYLKKFYTDNTDLEKKVDKKTRTTLESRAKEQ